MRLRVSLYRGIGDCRSRGSRMGDIPASRRDRNQEVAISGMPDERWGEAPHAFVVLKAGGHFQTVTNSDLTLQRSDSEHEHEQEQERCIRASSFLRPFVLRPSSFVLRHSKHVLRGKPAISKQ